MQGLALRLQFASTGTGADSGAIDAVTRHMDHLEENGILLKSASRPWGREGEVNFCMQFKSGQDLQKSRLYLGRIVWLSVLKNRPSALKVDVECGDKSLDHFSGGDIAPFVGHIIEKPTLTCSSEPAGPYRHTVTVEVIEKLEKNDAGRDIPQAEFTFVQSAINVKYASISERVDLMAFSSEDDEFSYSSENYKLTFAVDENGLWTGSLIGRDVSCR